MKKKPKHNSNLVTDRPRRIWGNIVEAASELDEVDKKSCDAIIRDLEQEILKYKQLAWLLHTAKARGVKINRKIMEQIEFHDISDMRTWAAGKTGNLKF